MKVSRFTLASALGGAAVLLAAGASGGAAEAEPPDANPIACTLYTVQDGVLKMSVQMDVLPDGADRTVRLEIKGDGSWREIARSRVVTPGWTALLRVRKWDAGRDVRFRVRTGDGHTRSGLVRRDPVEKEEIVVAAFTGNGQNPARDMKRDIVRAVTKIDPDLLVFTGDQTYNHRNHHWGFTLFGREFGDLTAVRPTVVIPDDHDVGQGNLWGAGGRKARRDTDGGYTKPAAYVNEVQRCQTRHLPDPYDARPVEQGITVYYTRLNVGGIDFAILEDRKFKSGCPGLVTREMGPRPDHITAEDYDPKALDAPGKVLLGKRQLAFLRAWGRDWRGAVMKAAISQTMFACVSTYHSKHKRSYEADLDSNGWPQSGRNRALRELRRCFAFHICGDQHLSTIVHHGVDAWGDAGWAFAVPSILNTWPRWWLPETPGRDREPGACEYTGNFLDGLGNRVTVYAATNPETADGDRFRVTDRKNGFGIIRFNKRARRITMACWPRGVDPTDPASAGKQYPGWPRTIHQEDNYARRAVAWLPTLQVKGMTDPVVQVVREPGGEVVYTLRIAGTRWRPKVFARGTYTVKVGELGTRRVKVLRGIRAGPEEKDRPITVEVGG